MLHGRYGMRLDGIYLRTASTKKEEHTLIRQFIRSAEQQQTRILLRQQKEEYCIGGWRASFIQPSSAEGFPPEIRLAESGSNWTPIAIILKACPPGSRQDILAGSHYTFGQIRLWAQKYKSCSFRDDQKNDSWPPISLHSLLSEKKKNIHNIPKSATLSTIHEI